MNKPLCIVAGVGPGNGLAFCKKFVKEGYKVAIVARSLKRMEEYAEDSEDIFPYACDLSNPDSIEATFSSIIDNLGVPQVLIYNAGSGLFSAPLETSLQDFEGAWKINALGLLCVCKLIAPSMIENGGGNILITGATASLRGGAKFAAFSSAKAAQRNLAQSLARSLGNQGIHVSLIIIDGIVDIPRTREMFPDLPDNLYMKPDAIAETYYSLTQQSDSAWTFEVDLRPRHESW
ncbi:SDR family NAD(P)-dependent oxidoreductase [Agarilytica rhodophyticola]|uniref:SDR family NAD(P)-dependent oxidoreductase n=1 Tax=Agarilytica rhodophyticola TaxID=1737490 RepID=UPI000B342586|nr:SDR family NAD(P)-dependent oxidoreductase [Agarilytica rhodophyticola]